VIAIAALTLAPGADSRVRTRTFTTGDITQAFGATTPPGNFTVGYITVPHSKQGRIKDIDVAVRLDHPVDSEVRLVLEHPTVVNGVTLSQSNGGDGANYGSGATKCGGVPTVFDDEATTPIAAGVAPFASAFQPQTPLSTFDGEKTKGKWALSAIDESYFNTSTGVLYCFALTITYKPL